MTNATAERAARATPASRQARFEILEAHVEDGLACLTITLRYRREWEAIERLRGVIELLQPPRRQIKPGETYGEYLLSARWQETRMRAVVRAGWKCQACSAHHHLEVHHNTYERRGNESDTDLLVLCRRCHDLLKGVVS